MSWASFITGGIYALFMYALFTSDSEDDAFEDYIIEENGSEIMVNDFTGRYVTLSCQTCRKLKKHKEVKPNLYQCVKCKRHVDIRAS
jgi:acetyl-CoA carboxylase beta subunit